MLNEEQHDTVLESIPYMALGVIRDSQLVLPIVNVAYYIYIYIYITEHLSYLRAAKRLAWLQESNHV